MLARIPALRTACLFLIAFLSADCLFSTLSCDAFFVFLFIIILSASACLFFSNSQHAAFPNRTLAIKFSFVLLAWSSCGCLFERTFSFRKAQANLISKLGHQQVFIHGKILEYPNVKKGTTNFLLAVHQITTPENTYRFPSGFQLKTLIHDSFALRKLEPGTCCTIRGKISEIKSPPNPGAFDYRTYAYHHGILGQLMVSNPGKIRVYPKGIFHTGWPLIVREALEHKLKCVMQDPQVYAVAAAMLLGSRQNMDPEILYAYAATGAMHVLSVSGLHVGILFWMISLLFKLLGNRFQKALIGCLLTILLIWFYAFLSGFSASVVRSALMFTIHLLAQFRQKKIHPLNLLGASAVCLMIADPFMVKDVGFQLSYLALLGIMLIYPLMQQWISTGNSLAGKVISASLVAVAAQLMTLPLSLYYFNQFPNLFILSNWLVLPMSFMIMVVGVLLLIYPSAFPGFGWMGILLEENVRLLNQSLKFVTALPYSVKEDLYPDVFTVAGIFAGIYCMLLLFKQYRSYWLLVGCGLIGMISAKKIICTVKDRNRLVVYAIRGATLLGIESPKVWYYHAEGLASQPSGYLLKNLRKNTYGKRSIPLGKGVETNRPIQVYRYRGKSITIVSGGTVLPFAIQTDYLIVTGKGYHQHMGIVNKVLEVKNMILDGSLDYSAKRCWQNLAREKGIQKNVWDVTEKGAFVVDL